MTGFRNLGLNNVKVEIEGQVLHMTLHTLLRAVSDSFHTLLYCAGRVNRTNRYGASPVLVAVLALAACQSAAISGNSGVTLTEPSLTGTQWLLEDLAGRGVLDRLQSTLDFAEPGRVSGRAGCNDFSGPIKWDAARITIGPLTLTRKACSPAVSDQETRYLEALAGARAIRADGPYLLIDTLVAGKPLKLTRMR
jgi:heat shock protein HslJ